MITHTTDITLDIACKNVRAEVTTKQDDKGTRFINVGFVSGGDVVSLAGIDRAELRVLRPDGKMSVTAAQINGDRVTAELPEIAVEVYGRGYGDIVLYDSEENRISAARFNLIIQPGAVSNTAISGESDFSLYRDELAALTSELADFRQEYASQMSEFAVDLGNVITRFGGLSFRKLTQAEYDALGEYDPSTVYYAVDDSGKVKQYLGSAELSSGSVPTLSAVSLTATPAGAVVHAERQTRTVDLTGVTWEQGSIQTPGGENLSSNNRIRTADYINLDGLIVTDIAVFAKDTNGVDLLVDYSYYDVNKKLLKTVYWHDSGTQQKVLSNTKYLRILLKRSGDPTVTPDILGSCVMKEFLS